MTILTCQIRYGRNKTMDKTWAIGWLYPWNCMSQIREDNFKLKCTENISRAFKKCYSMCWEQKSKNRKAKVLRDKTQLGIKGLRFKRIQSVLRNVSPLTFKNKNSKVQFPKFTFKSPVLNGSSFSLSLPSGLHLFSSGGYAIWQKVQKSSPLLCHGTTIHFYLIWNSQNWSHWCHLRG